MTRGRPTGPRRRAVGAPAPGPLAAGLGALTAAAAVTLAVPTAAPATAAPATAAPAAVPAGERAADRPADVLDLDDWKITLPIGEDGEDGEDDRPLEIFQPELADYAHASYFRVSDDGDAVRFRAPVNGVTTSGSSYPRAELREMEPGGEDETEWSATSGTHTMTVREAFTHLPAERPYLVGAQIHGGDDDVTVVRLEGTELWITEGDTRHHHLITDDYELGTVFEVTYVVADGEIEVYYNGELETTLEHTDPTNYFKAGAYTQANCDNSAPCDEDNYGEVEIHELTITHEE
ncbi:polysaccharide lyase family 7 protein [Streptomyces sp. DSM 44915]|uniref:Polysaccharide lyase family 7 protein n=1 Tax=Streptomyces chisholmiae TaxID=3075540 RepID=A0ABU2JU96_9ACTN|nr:polysaccharide lyase family 7 protein [Streptomyces sp. DSM 44915]MDT0268560.1 polysaccharide lyase family 7 protein [Streptomyces sp. DSM 44915]